MVLIFLDYYEPILLYVQEESLLNSSFIAVILYSKLMTKTLLFVLPFTSRNEFHF